MDLNKVRDALDAFAQAITNAVQKIKNYLHKFIDAIDDFIHRHDNAAEDFARYANRSIRHSMQARKHAQEAMLILKRQR